MNLPQGPNEVSRLFFAPARLAVAVCTAKAWGKNIQPQGRYVTVMSRVLEKGARYTAQVMDAIISRLDLTGVRTLKIWSDCGPHFRCSEFMATVVFRNAEEKKLNTKIRFGVEKEFKNGIDRNSLQKPLDRFFLDADFQSSIFCCACRSHDVSIFYCSPIS